MQHKHAKSLIPPPTTLQQLGTTHGRANMPSRQFRLPRPCSYSVLLTDVLPASAPNPAGSGQLEVDVDREDEGDGDLDGRAPVGSASGLSFGGFLKKQTDALCSLVEEYVGLAGVCVVSVRLLVCMCLCVCLYVCQLRALCMCV